MLRMVCKPSSTGKPEIPPRSPSWLNAPARRVLLPPSFIDFFYQSLYRTPIMSRDRVNNHALSELAAMVAVHIERAPGPLEKRLVLMHGFAQAQRLNSAVTDDPA